MTPVTTLSSTSVRGRRDRRPASRVRRGTLEIIPEDALHVLRNPVRTFAMDEEMTMVIGADRAGRLIEDGVGENHDEPGLVIVHAMPARAKFLKVW